MKIQINDYNDLLNFIKRDDIETKQATEIVCLTLNVFCPLLLSKEELIESTEYYINKFGQNRTSERPLFLQQKEFEFSIKDFY